MPDPPQVGLLTIAREWGRIGCVGFGGPPAHVALFRRLCVDDRGWLAPSEFEDGVAAVNLLPGPASTQLAIFAAWRMGGPAGAVLGGLCFILPGLVAILALAAVFLAAHPPVGVAGAAAGAGAVVPAVAVQAALSLAPASWTRARPEPVGPTGERRRLDPGRARWLLYLFAGGLAAATIGPWLVLVLAAAGGIETAARGRRLRPGSPPCGAIVAPLSAFVALGAVRRSVALVAAGGTGAVAWVAFKVGALSYGGGFVIIPLMQRDAVHIYHWMGATQFLSAVALGQITPGPVVLTVAVVGYAAGGVGMALMATLSAFTPSFVLVLAAAPRFGRLRADRHAQAFLTGAGAAAIGAIAGSAVPLAVALHHPWQAAVLGAGLVWVVALRRGIVGALLGGGVVGAALALGGLAAP